MVKCVIVDDEVDAQLTIEYMLKRHCPNIVILGKADGVKSAINLIEEKAPAFIFLDIKLNDGNGFDILDKIDVEKVKVIFTTAYNDYALEAIKKEAIDYLLKPINPLELKVAVEKVVSKIKSESLLIKEDRIIIKKLSIKGENKTDVVLTSDIIRCQSEINYTFIHLRSGEKIMVAKTLKYFENELKDYGFVRVHQSHLVNLNEITSINSTKSIIHLKMDNEEIPYSRTYYNKLLKSEMLRKI
jgi:two-component system LytT family response regulator